MKGDLWTRFGTEIRARYRTWIDNGPRRTPPGEPVIGLALGGGFARGLAHLGVLKVLEENRIPIHMIAGTSVGSIVGGAYAGGANVDTMIECARSVKFRDFAGWTISRMGLASNERMEKYLMRFFPATTFEKLRIPFAVTTTDLLTGEPVVFRRGDMIGPVRASCAYPGLFLPVKIAGRTLVDGAFSCPIPIEALKQMGATHILAVYLGPGFHGAPPGNMIQIVNQCISLLQTRIGREWRQEAHVIIEPAVTGFAWDDFDQGPPLIAAGEAAARKALPAIRAWKNTPARLPLPSLVPTTVKP